MRALHWVPAVPCVPPAVPPAQLGDPVSLQQPAPFADNYREAQRSASSLQQVHWYPAQVETLTSAQCKMF